MQYLGKTGGFPMDLRIPCLDEVTCGYMDQWFGSEYVDKAFEMYHRSTPSFTALKEDVLKYNLKYVPGKVRQDQSYKMVLESVRQQFVVGKKLIPITLGSVFKNKVMTVDKSPGLPWIKKGFKTKTDVFSDKKATGKIYEAWDRIGRGRDYTLPDTCASMWVKLAKPEEEKIRLVWGYPCEVIVEEARFFLPYMKELKESDAPIAYRAEVATGSMALIDDMCQTHPNDQYLMIDFSNFDKTVPPWLIRDAFAIIMENFDLDHVICSEGKIWPFKRDKTIRRYKRLVDYFINTPLRLCNGERWKKSGGVPSGSMFTDIVNTIVNSIVCRYCIYNTTSYLPLCDMYLGNNQFAVVRGIVNLDGLADLMLSDFGMILNRDKSILTTNPSNVQFFGYFNRRGLP